MFRVRQETQADHAAIGEVHTLSFPSRDEARLVDALRAAGHVVVSLVAQADGGIVGHVLLSKLEAGTLRAVALGPVAVLPAYRRQGIADALIRAGLTQCRDVGHDLAIVVGAPAYYRRFGFASEIARRLHSAYSGVGEPWMALELKAGSLPDTVVDIIYPDPWSDLS